jgi:hypothetical protein
MTELSNIIKEIRFYKIMMIFVFIKINILRS